MGQQDIYDEYKYPENTTSINEQDKCEYPESTITTQPSLYHFPYFNPPLDKVPRPTRYPKDHIISTNENITYYDYYLTDFPDFPFFGSFCVRPKDTQCNDTTHGTGTPRLHQPT